MNLEPIYVGANGLSINTLCKSKLCSCRTSWFLMDAASDKSNRNVGAEIGIVEAKRITSNLI